MGFEERLEGHRVDLTGYCYRMLADLGEAEDAVQETMIRAWRKADSFDERKAALCTWLYRIASNVCIDMLRSSQRRGLAMDLTSASTPEPDPGPAVNLSRFVQPAPDHRVLPDDGDPAELAITAALSTWGRLDALTASPPPVDPVLEPRGTDQDRIFADHLAAHAHASLASARAEMIAGANPAARSIAEEAIQAGLRRDVTRYR